MSYPFPQSYGWDEMRVSIVRDLTKGVIMKTREQLEAEIRGLQDKINILASELKSLPFAAVDLGESCPIRGCPGRLQMWSQNKKFAEHTTQTHCEAEYRCSNEHIITVKGPWRYV